MKKAFILVLTNFFILTLILLGKPIKAQTTEITGQFLYGLQLYVLPEKQTTPDYTTAIYSSTIDQNDFISSGLYQNWLQPRLPDGINGYIYLVDSTHTIKNVYLGGGYLEQGQTVSYPYEPSIEMKHYGAPLIDIFILNPVNRVFFETPTLDYIVYFENNDGTTPRIKLIDASLNENDYNRVKLAINGYDTGYNSGYFIGYNNGQVDGYNTGYDDGETNGYNRGYNAGQYDFYNEYYQQIYDEGYNAGLGDRQLGVNTVVNFNQLVKNGNFTNTTDWFYYFDPTILTANNNVLNLKCNGYIRCDVRQTNIPININDKYIFIYSVRGVTDYNYVIASCDGYNTNHNLTENWQTYSEIFTATSINPLYFYFYATSTSGEFELKNVMLINLTQIYGSGNEPTTSEGFSSDFPSQYYDYTLSTYYSIDYENGYKTGYDNGYPLGYDDGVSYQATQQLTSDGWIKNIFTGIGSFLALEIIPNVSIGLIVGIPFIISVAWFVIKMARGGGNN